MASTAKQSGGSEEPALFLDILTKEEKEALLNKKMEEIRRKNEALRKRHEFLLMSKMKERMYPARMEIEADRKAAHQMGRLVNPRTQVTVTPNKRNDQQREPREMKGVAFTPGEERKPSRLSAGRGKRLANMSKETLKAQDHEMANQTIQTPVSPTTPGPPGQSNQPNRRKGTGRTTVQPEPRSPDSENGPPPDPTFNFLSDRSREGPLPEKVREQRQTARHPRNFGGTSFNNVQHRMKNEKEKQAHFEYSSQENRYGGPPRSKMEMEMKMTGRERREYSDWKSERERIDQSRIDRQLNNSGDWRREWDHDKVEQERHFRSHSSFESDSPETANARRTEPGRRPAGRIGSGRFDRGDSLEERKRGDAPGITVIGYAVDGQVLRLGDEIDEETFKLDPNRLEDTLETLADHYDREQRGRGFREQGRGRGGKSGMQMQRGRGTARPSSNSYDRHRASSTGSDETSRSVEEQNDSLIVKIDNEFATKPRFRSSSSEEDFRAKRRSFDGDSGDWRAHRGENGERRGGHRVTENGDRRYRDDHDRRGDFGEQRGGERRLGGNDRGSRRGGFRGTGGDDGERCDGFREPYRGGRGGRPRGRAVDRGRRAGSGRIRDDRHMREGDSNLADVEPHIAMGTFDENWDYGDLQPGQMVQIISADLSEDNSANPKEKRPQSPNKQHRRGKEGSVEQRQDEDVGVRSPEEEEEWEDATDFYDIKDARNYMEDEDDDEDNDEHNSSAESLERFIQEHTLKLDVSVESMVPPMSPLSNATSPYPLVRKNPLSAVKVLDWGASENYDNKSSMTSGSLNSSHNADDSADLSHDLSESLDTTEESVAPESPRLSANEKARKPQENGFHSSEEISPQDSSDLAEVKVKDKEGATDEGEAKGDDATSNSGAPADVATANAHADTNAQSKKAETHFSEPTVEMNDEESLSAETASSKIHPVVQQLEAGGSQAAVEPAGNLALKAPLDEEVSESSDSSSSEKSEQHKPNESKTAREVTHTSSTETDEERVSENAETAAEPSRATDGSSSSSSQEQTEATGGPHTVQDEANTVSSEEAARDASSGANIEDIAVTQQG